MTRALLDVNVLIALVDPAHIQHDPAHDWFARVGYKAFATCPLTENGLNQARLHGEELARLGIKITHCYSSPALRSIQTADKILEGMNLKDKVPIRIEIGLFELLSWQSYLPCRYPFIDKHTLRAYGYNIDVNYESILNYENLKEWFRNRRKKSQSNRN